MTLAHRRARTALPAAVAALALGGAVLTAVPAQAAETPRPAVELPAPEVASKAELKKRAEGALNALPKDTKQDEGASEAPKTPKSSTSPNGADPKIIGGVDTPAGAAPWMVQLYGVDKATGEGFFCGGTLIAPAKVLTAAHCVHGADWGTSGAVVAGATQRASEDANGNWQFHGGLLAVPKRAWLNPAYNDAAIRGDVAVLTLDRPMPFKTLPIAAPTDTASYKPGTKGTVYGWGRTSGTPGSAGSETLKQASLKIQPDASCPGWADAKDTFVAGQMFCAGEPATGSDAGTVSPCNGDSGGPLVVGGRVVGIVSWGVRDCIAAGALSVFTKVSTFTPQVASVVDDANLTDDNKADVIARKTNYNTYIYRSRGTSLGLDESLGVWNNVNVIRQGDLNKDANQDIVFRTPAGELYWARYEWRGESIGYEWTETRIGVGWSGFKDITIPGDLNQDGNPDLIAKDSSGNLWMWGGRGNGSFAAKVKIGVGWSSYAVYGKGDYSGDGKPDIITRDTANRLWMYKGTGHPTAPISGRVLVGKGWNFNAFVTTGDLTGDNKADFLVRDSAGSMWAYKGTGNATTPFATAAKVKMGVGFTSFNLFG
ncbi:trypsin-like serine protease [Streptomyces purpureus]|uniref:Peptidase S1 domain-containing protein n=1 Tax=Streptomyces purpureus TaxID=1951 RepID=A0A918H3B8_9ACTN|nr:trypsin-like serine protease [Streptomyces purpureus]GGT33398.1 hypothetical protein GCM10014713_28700 [Streptomyces purpureus]